VCLILHTQLINFAFSSTKSLLKPDVQHSWMCQALWNPESRSWHLHSTWKYLCVCVCVCVCVHACAHALNYANHIVHQCRAVSVIILPYRITTRSRCILSLFDTFLWITVSSFLRFCYLLLTWWRPGDRGWNMLSP
jgi:hypothetical protein